MLQLIDLLILKLIKIIIKRFDILYMSLILARKLSLVK